jgi:aminoglycoside phosphotransferase family enzyme/predicted kinase
LLEFLSRVSSYPHGPAGVTMIQTHASWVFVAPPFVYKVKKPVRFPFLDFSTLELRHADCEREVVLNRRLAGDVYLGVVPICESKGHLQIGGGGSIVEWAVKMREMDSRYFLSHLIKEGGVGHREIDRIVAVLSRFYNAGPVFSEEEMAAASRQTLENVFSNLAIAREHAGVSLSPAAFSAIERFTRRFVQVNESLLDSRITEGRFRDCHGDLHLEHIYLRPDDLRIYDCIEFNDRLRHIDIACDIAFLAMDLDFNQRADLAAYLTEQCTHQFHDDGLAGLIDFYKCYRACVRGKVETLHATGGGIGVQEAETALGLARRYYRLALQYALAGSRSQAFVIMGRVASGKSTLAQALGQEMGWDVHSSDRVRKELGGVSLLQRGDASQRAALYSPDMTERVYAVLQREALLCLKRGRSVVLDATYSSRLHRDELRNVLGREGFEPKWIEVTVEDEIARERLRKRESVGGQMSDAREEDQATLNALYEPPAEVPAGSRVTLCAHADLAATLQRLLEELATGRACRTDPIQIRPHAAGDGMDA